MAKATITIEDYLEEDGTPSVRFNTKAELSEEEKLGPPTVALLFALHIGHIWTDQSVDLKEVWNRAVQESDARRQAQQCIADACAKVAGSS